MIVFLAKWSLAAAPFPWVYLNQSLKRSGSAVENNHRRAIFAHMRRRLDNQKWAYVYRRSNGNVNALIQAQRISPMRGAGSHVFTFIHP